MARKKKAQRRTRNTSSSSLAALAYKQDADEIVFEDEASQDGLMFQDHIITLYGPPKIGKTTAALKFEGVYLLPTEPGYKWAKVRKTKINNWATFIKFVQWAEKNKSKVKTVQMWVIDTADNLAKFCMQYVCGREGISHPSDEEWGKGWEAFRDEFNHWILRLTSIGPGTLFIAHEQEREVLSRSITITKATPALPKTCYTILNNLSDMILYMSYLRVKTKKAGKVKSKEVRCVFTRPTENYDAGDRTGLLPDAITFETEQEIVDEIMSYFE